MTDSAPSCRLCGKVTDDLVCVACSDAELRERLGNAEEALRLLDYRRCEGCGEWIPTDAAAFRQDIVHRMNDDYFCTSCWDAMH
jgi:hypothetical protein